VDADQLQDAVRQVFTAAGGDRMGWPDPHPGHTVADEEYSRVSDPDKFRIITVRAAAWITALVEGGLATATPLTDADDVRGAWSGEPPHLGASVEATWLHPVAGGAVPLLLCLDRVQEAEHAYLVVGIGEPAVQVDTLPDCGCDACDSGSTDLLQALDRRLIDVVSGELTYIRLPDGVVCGGGDGWSAGWTSGAGRDREQVEALIVEARAGRSSYQVVHGRPWW